MLSYYITILDVNDVNVKKYHAPAADLTENQNVTLPMNAKTHLIHQLRMAIGKNEKIVGCICKMRCYYLNRRSFGYLCIISSDDTCP